MEFNLSRKKAYFMNGGAGRVIASIPAFEKLYENDKDFIIVCEGGMDFYKGHPDLFNRTYDVWHKNILINTNVIKSSIENNIENHVDHLLYSLTCSKQK